MNFLIQNEQLGLRPITEADVTDAYVNWMNDKEVVAGLEPRIGTITKQDLLNFVNSINGSTNNLFLAIIDKKSNHHIGNIKLGDISRINSNAHLGILIGDKNFWNKGVGFQACDMLIRHAFAHMGINKIWLSVFSNNIPAYKLYQKLGFVTEGVLKKHVCINGELYDKILMSVFKE